MIAVVDTSAFIGLVTLDEAEMNARLADRLTQVTPHVPDIIDVEFQHALRGLALGNRISAERATHARDLFEQIPKVHFATHLLTDRIWSLRHNLGAYDACFIALAEALDIPLITADAEQVAASGHHATIEAY